MYIEVEDGVSGSYCAGGTCDEDSLLPSFVLLLS